MIRELKSIKQKFVDSLNQAKDISVLDSLEIKYLGRKSGELTNLLKGLKDLPETERREAGQLANEIKKEIEEALAQKKQKLVSQRALGAAEKEAIDVTQPKLPKKEPGHLHPITLVQNELEDLFTSMGFMILDGPELESEYYNFTSLNMPPNDSARDTQDTFYISAQGGSPPKADGPRAHVSGGKAHEQWVMRTQTSAVQARALQKYGAPLRAVVPGRCFRNEATDAAHDHTFYQLEGLVVDREISIAHLIAVMKELLKGVFKREIEIRLRPGHFQFVEPGFELDIKCLICGGTGCGACKHSGWVETVPCGPVHPKVLEYGGLNPKEWTGFAFGLGLTRLVMQKYRIEDIRLLMGGDLRFLKQF